MENIKENRYIIKSGSYIIDLDNVDFVTWKENGKDEGTYWVKLHIGTKEARYVCDGKAELKEIITAWCTLRGKNITIEECELGDEDEFNF